MTFVAMSAIAILPASATGGSARRVGLYSCTGKVVVRPGNFVITCADANTQLTATKWTQWDSTLGVGTTRFAMNLCNPTCVASKISYFPASVVRLSAPIRTSAHGWLFSKLTVTYRLHGRMKTFRFSWIGDPAFKT
ncbi:MAG: hypothetical protein WCF24_08045 [Acidimicrobiales bacterium]